MIDWLSATAMLLAGLIVGFMFVFGMRRRQGRSDLERADLEAKRDAMVARLRDEISPEERGRLESETAGVLRKLDSLSGAPAILPTPVAGEIAGPPQKATALKGFLWGVTSAAVIGGIAFFVMQSAKPKSETAAPMAAVTETDNVLRDLERSVQQNPDNLDTRDELAKAYLDREKLSSVFEQTQYVLQRAPNDARALTYEALVRVAMGQPGDAGQMLPRATQSDPNLLDAWLGIAWLSARSGRIADAESAIKEAKRRHPEQAARLDELMAHMRAPQAVPAQSTTEPTAAAQRAPASNDSVHITLQIAGAAKYPAGAVIFIIAREAGVTSGPPAAVKRLPIGQFPISIDLSASDSMMGQPLPAKMRIDARLDSDGDAATRDPNDPKAAADGVALGESITLTLK